MVDLANERCEDGEFFEEGHHRPHLGHGENCEEKEKAPPCFDEGAPPRNKRLDRRNCPANPEEVVLAATAIAITLTKNKTLEEIQTLLNLFTTTSCLIDSVLKQRLINKPFEVPVLEVEL